MTDLLATLRRLVTPSGAAAAEGDLVPPRKLFGPGAEEYRKVGEEFKHLFLTYGGLKPHHHVLEVGSGIGRMTVPLTGVLGAQGEYQGFDIDRPGLLWCQEHITPRFPHFQFQLADVLNHHYNPKGRHAAADYRFPFPDERFDFVFLTSVFTHMFPRDLENYLKEIARVLKRGEKCLITFFLLNEESRRLIKEGRSSQNFIHELEGCVTTHREDPEDAIAYPEPYVRDRYAGLGLVIEEPVHYGSWCGRPEFLSYQDIVIARKA